MAEVPGTEAGLIFEGDCLEVTRRMAEGSIDLLYSDPPFFTKRDFEGKVRAGGKMGENGKGGGAGGRG